MPHELWEALKKMGEPGPSLKWVEGQPDYVATLDLSGKDVPDLVAIMELWADESFFDNPTRRSGQDEETAAVDERARESLIMTPILAWRSLGQLGAVEAVEPMLKMLDILEEMDDDWFISEFPYVFQMIGPAALPLLREYLYDPAHKTFSRICVSDGIFQIAQRHDATRNEAIGIFRQVLQGYRENPIELNANVCDHLIDLHSVEDAELIERAFADEYVDEGFFGTWKDARERLGVEGLGLAPDKPYPTIGDLPQWQAEYRKEREAALKNKAKKKRQEKSRKRNRKKR